MRVSLIIVFFSAAISFLIDYYIWRQIRGTEKNGHKASLAYAISAIVTFMILIVAMALPRRSGSDGTLVAIMWLIFVYSTIYISKAVYIIFSLIGKIPLLWKGTPFGKMWIAGLAASLAVFAALWWGALVNRLSYTVKDVTVEIPDLPAMFDGYTIAQISDLHVGAYGSDTTFVSKIVDAVNALQPDLIVFTGDIVNRRTDELIPHSATLRRLHAHDGVISILGNHDYGDYSSWDTPADKKANMEMLYKLQSDMGWNLLNNRTEWLRRGKEKLAVIGVENWGEPPFPTYGNLDKAYPTISDSQTKILLSHNPVHWDRNISNNVDSNIALTLSGHTHAMQFEIGKFSPSAWRYKEWDGLYTDSLGRHLYVNRGIGTVGFPARIGAKPEITLIRLCRIPTSD